MKQVPCRACGKSMVFLRSRGGKPVPVNAETVKEGDAEFDHTRHVSHFADCPAAVSFRRGQP